MKPALRKPLLTFHLWTGITVGLVFTVVALSGAALIFRSSLERSLDPQLFIVVPGATRLPINDLVARAKAAHPGPEFLSVRLWSDPTRPLTALFNDKKYVHLNPYTGAVLGIRARYGEGFGWIEAIHKYLLLEPTMGETINGSFAIAFVALLGAGLVLWWPATRRALIAGLTFNRQQTLPVFYKGRPLDCEFRMDLVVENTLVVEIKAVQALLPLHEAQLLTYLKVSGLHAGLLLNFNEARLTEGIRRRLL